MLAFIGLHFRRSVLTLSSAALSSGGKRLPFLCMIGLLRSLCFPSELADCLKSEDKPKALSVSLPNSLFTDSSDWQSLETLERWGQRFKTSKKQLFYTFFFALITTVAIVSYFPPKFCCLY